MKTLKYQFFYKAAKKLYLEILERARFSDIYLEDLRKLEVSLKIIHTVNKRNQQLIKTATATQ